VPSPPKRPHSIWDGRFILDVADLPIIGSPTNAQVIVSLFDYTCRFCRVMHPRLLEAQRVFSNDLTIISLPMPLDPDCNPTVQRAHPDHIQACAYAVVGLSVWRADSRKHREFEDWVFTGERPPPISNVVAYATQLIGSNALQRAAADPWVTQTLRTSLSIYDLHFRSGAGDMPQIIIGGKLARGTFPQAELNQILAERLGLKLPH
jgi:hypothetical protein